jgi:hypothetical protein
MFIFIRFIEKLIESGAVTSLLDSLVENPKGDGVQETLRLLETIATHNPEALLAGGGAEISTRLIQSGIANGKTELINAAARTLEKLN